MSLFETDETVTSVVVPVRKKLMNNQSFQKILYIVILENIGYSDTEQ